MTEQKLTPEIRALLKRPFTAEAVKFRVQGRISANKTVRVITYIDARLVQERLDDVDPDWTVNYNFFAGEEGDRIGRKENVPTAANLTVCGVTRPDVGQNDTDTVDDKHVKSAVSDAFKRAAVTFGVGRYLYTLGEAKLVAGEYWEKNGKVGGINEKGLKRLRADYRKFISTKAFIDRWGEAIDYGDALSATVSHVEEDVEPEKAEPTPEPKEAVEEPTEALDNIPTLGEYETVVAELAKLTGHSADAAIKWMAAKKTERTKNTALKRAIKKALDHEADQDAIDKILKENNLLSVAN